MGKVTEGMVGTGFLYTNKDSLTIGIGCMLSDFKTNPNRTTPLRRCWKSSRSPPQHCAADRRRRDEGIRRAH